LSIKPFFLKLSIKRRPFAPLMRTQNIFCQQNWLVY
jgi:hypothetical protein